MSERFWYYTTGHTLDQVFKDGELALVEEPALSPPRKVVWLSTDPDWELTCNRFVKGSTGIIMPLTKEQNDRAKGGLYRIEVPDGGLLSWGDLGTNQDAKKFAKQVRDRGGNPRRWRFSETAIAIEKWLSFEKWDPQSGRWEIEPYSGNHFAEMAAEMLLCADAAQQSRRAVPALVLIYSLIDTLAWLAVQDLTTGATGKAFMAWVDQYMKPSSRFPSKCASIDLYGARCGLLHTRTPNSDKSRSNAAKPLLYAWGANTTADLQALIDITGSNHVPVHASDLFAATVDGLCEFMAHLERDRTQAVIVRQKAGTMLPTGEESLRADQRRRDVLEIKRQADALGSEPAP